MKKEPLLGAGMSQPSAPYSMALRVQANEMLYIAGQGPTAGDGSIVGAGDIEAQVRQVFDNIQALLEAAGATFNNVVFMNMYVTDIRFRETITMVRNEILEAPFPAATMVQIGSLASTDWLVEIDAVAALD